MSRKPRPEPRWSAGFLKRSRTNGQLREYLLSREKGIYCIEGPSLCGKTSFLRSLEASEEKTVHRVSHEYLGRYVLKEMLPDWEEAKATLECDILCVEDVDLVWGRIATLESAAQFFNEYSRTRPVILSGIRLRRRVPQLIDRLTTPTFFRFRPK